MLAPSIGQEDERYRVPLEELQSLRGVWNGVGAPDEDAIYAVRLSDREHREMASAARVLGDLLERKRKVRDWRGLL